MVFNKPCEIKDWENSEKPNFIYEIESVEWVKDKESCTGGHYKNLNYKESWAKAWENANDRDKELLKKLPNFDEDVFFEITGIKV